MPRGTCFSRSLLATTHVDVRPPLLNRCNAAHLLRSCPIHPSRGARVRENIFVEVP